MNVKKTDVHCLLWILIIYLLGFFNFINIIYIGISLIFANNSSILSEGLKKLDNLNGMIYYSMNMHLKKINYAFISLFTVI